MENKYFLHQIKRTNGAIDKGIVVKDTYEAALQSYHSYLGAYAYGQNPDTNFVDCMITEALSMVTLNHEQWIKVETAPAEEPEEEPAEDA